MLTILIIDGEPYQIMQELKVDALKNISPKTWEQLIRHRIHSQYVLKQLNGTLHFYAAREDDNVVIMYQVPASTTFNN